MKTAAQDSQPIKNQPKPTANIALRKNAKRGFNSKLNFDVTPVPVSFYIDALGKFSPRLNVLRPAVQRRSLFKSRMAAAFQSDTITA